MFIITPINTNTILTEQLPASQPASQQDAVDIEAAVERQQEQHRAKVGCVLQRMGLQRIIEGA